MVIAPDPMEIHFSLLSLIFPVFEESFMIVLTVQKCLSYTIYFSLGPITY